jgi:hypothetical protein
MNIEEYSQIERKVKTDVLFLLAYQRGCIEKLNMDYIESLLTAYNILYKKNNGFTEPFQFDVSDYEDGIMTEYPVLHKDKIKLTLTFNHQ